MPKTARPVRVYDFTAFSRRTPNVPPPAIGSMRSSSSMPMRSSRSRRSATLSGLLQPLASTNLSRRWQVRLRCRLTTPRSALNRPSLYRMQSHSGEEKGVNHGAAA